MTRTYRKQCVVAFVAGAVVALLGGEWWEAGLWAMVAAAVVDFVEIVR